LQHSLAGLVEGDFKLARRLDGTPLADLRPANGRLAIAESILSDSKGLRRHFRVAFLPLPPKPRRAALTRNASLVLTHAILKNSNTRSAGLSRKSRFFWSVLPSIDPPAGARHCSGGNEGAGHSECSAQPRIRDLTRRDFFMSSPVTRSKVMMRKTNRSKLGVSDASRAAKIVEGAKGKRLQYRRPNESPFA
jgi:hypothetical protein